MQEFSLNTQKKNSLSSILYISDLFLFAFKTTYARSCSLAQRESSSEKKEEHQHPQSFVVLTLFSAKVRARFENERERERETESFFCDEREISVHLGS